VSSLEDKEEFKKTLLELLGENETVRTGKKFFFPENVEKGYNIIQGLSVTDFAKFIIPSVFISLIVVLLPPYSSVIFWIIKVVLIILISTVGFILAIARPIKSRNNIKYFDYIKTRISFSRKQKMYYIKPKDRGGF